jgi:hypothetical protein
MTHLYFLCFTKIVASFGQLLTGLAAIFLAYWAWRKYFRERENETKLSIQIEIKTFANASNKQVYISVVLTNKGNVEIRSLNRFKQKDSICYKDNVEIIKYPVSLQVKKVKTTQSASNWFDPNHYEPIDGLEEINLLSDLETPEKPNDPSFYLEPKDDYNLGCWLKLEEGFYEAKLIFIGEKLPDEFWTKRFPFEIT